MTATDAQVRLMMKERRQGKTQEQAAVKANILSRKTVHKYEQLGKLPNELKKHRHYRTRRDPFETDWAEVEKKLQEAPELEAKTLFDWLCERDGTQGERNHRKVLAGKGLAFAKADQSAQVSERANRKIVRRASIRD